MLRTPVVVSGSNCKLTRGAEQQTRESGFKNRRDNTPQQQQQQQHSTTTKTKTNRQQRGCKTLFNHSNVHDK